VFIPYRADVPMRRWPIANFVIIAINVLVFFAGYNLIASDLDGLLLDGNSPITLFTSLWLHAGLFHLIGNMVFLWVFGNAVCAKVGNLTYSIFYVGCGLAASMAHLVLNGQPALGASGAVNGMVGAFLVLYPRNEVSCFFLLVFRPICFSLSSVWIILYWFTFDVYGAAAGAGGVAYFAHLGGFAAGFAAITLGLGVRLIGMERDERSLYDIVFRKRPPVLDPAAGMPRPPERYRDATSQTTTAPAAAGHHTAAVRRPTPAPPPSRSVRLRCPCGQPLRVPRALGGRRARCPACQQAIQLPAL
jgi:rhomboid family protein